jgi:hypothetical protein
MRDTIRLQEFWFEIRGQMSEVEPEAENEVGSPLTKGISQMTQNLQSLNAELGISTRRVLEKVAGGRSEAKTSGSSE